MSRLIKVKSEDKIFKKKDLGALPTDLTFVNLHIFMDIKVFLFTRSPYFSFVLFFVIFSLVL